MSKTVTVTIPDDVAEKLIQRYVDQGTQAVVWTRTVQENPTTYFLSYLGDVVGAALAPPRPIEAGDRVRLINGPAWTQDMEVLFITTDGRGIQHVLSRDLDGDLDTSQLRELVRL